MLLLLKYLKSNAIKLVITRKFTEIVYFIIKLSILIVRVLIKIPIYLRAF